MSIQANFSHSPRRWCGLRLLALFLASTLGLSFIQPVLAAPVWQIRTVDSAGAVGQHTALVLDNSGNPVISYYGNGALKLVHCGDATCSSGNTIVTVDSAGVLGQYNSLVLDSSGNPVISYYDAHNKDLKLAHCGDAMCSSGNTLMTVDNSADDVGQYTSLALDSSGYPVISYWELDNLNLKVAHCGDAMCSSGNISRTVDSAGTVGEYTSLVLDSSGHPVISYQDVSNGALKVAHCGDATCSSGNIIRTVDSAGNVGAFNSLALDSSGHPVISYLDSSNRDLKLARCGDATCSSGNTIRTLDSAGDVGLFTGLALDSSDNPVISYFDISNGDLKLVHCGDATCSSGNTIQTVDSAGNVGSYTALALDSSDNPVISYFDQTNFDLKLARPVSDSTPPVITPVLTPATPDGQNGWYVNDVTVSFTCADEAGGSGLATNTVAGATLATDGANQSVTNTGQCSDNAGNVATLVTVSGLNLDKTAPTLNPMVSPNPVTVGGAATVTAHGADALSGLASESCAALDTSTTGVKSVTCTASDNAGNAARVTVDYTVLAPPSLFQQVQMVRSSLAALLPSGDNKTDKALTKALGKIDQALAANLWQPDGNHLILIGDDVFNRLRDAVQELTRIKNPVSTVRSASTTLTAISRTLAQTALDEAIAAQGDPNKIAKAQSKLRKGDSEAAKGKLDKAIAQYEDAWEYAQQALGLPVASSLSAEEQSEVSDEDSAAESNPSDAEESEAGSVTIFLPQINR